MKNLEQLKQLKKLQQLKKKYKDLKFNLKMGTYGRLEVFEDDIIRNIDDNKIEIFQTQIDSDYKDKINTIETFWEVNDKTKGCEVKIIHPVKCKAYNKEKNLIIPPVHLEILDLYFHLYDYNYESTFWLKANPAQKRFILRHLKCCSFYLQRKEH